MIRVRTPSRLHFGLLSPRTFGGVGLMVESPGIQLAITPAASWAAEGPLAERALAFAHRFVQSLPSGVMSPQRLVLEQCAPEHHGLGTGTQLGLSVAKALAIAAGQPEMEAAQLARRIGRGRRSAIGVHGFARGGFLVEAGKPWGSEADISSLQLRLDFPEAWRVVLFLPSGSLGRHGEEERRAFGELVDHDYPTFLASPYSGYLQQMISALSEREDLNTFGEALFEFNARVGEIFARVQGGTYASPLIAELIAFIRQQGIRGTGQSSWGPTVFAIVGAEEQAQHLALQVRERFALSPQRTIITRAANRGAEIHIDGEKQ